MCLPHSCPGLAIVLLLVYKALCSVLGRWGWAGGEHKGDQATAPALEVQSHPGSLAGLAEAECPLLGWLAVQSTGDNTSERLSTAPDT